MADQSGWCPQTSSHAHSSSNSKTPMGTWATDISICVVSAERASPTPHHGHTFYPVLTISYVTTNPFPFNPTDKKHVFQPIGGGLQAFSWRFNGHGPATSCWQHAPENWPSFAKSSHLGPHDGHGSLEHPALSSSPA
eukprot:CAMPEP_0174373330 /NCGR_PEP_ID=MMETSP0811_2-20130205/106690_1 /TAXON_ID=73025 ORGANISM="Eutreptiella gymnastica-like, Strain CCMP1594" /NCGR_SAMPLE_ID=MMETSP0811_2 /ASSEMBLY_ACC=CAM_ASM_000667 /LENGTH=136 /DNA_ID=CAMNT_0015521541 /DNA_START=147 /DNA_END=555 /DNA_ORIENTATION=+